MDAASSCVGVAPQSALLSRSFTDAAAIARALSFSLSDTAAAEPPATTAPVGLAFAHGPAGAGPHQPPPTVGGAAAALSPSARCRLGPAGGRAEKRRRRPRPSKRAPTTYISTDAATFRLMVQRVTGVEEEAGLRQDADGLGLVLPHFGVVGPLLPLDPAAGHVAAGVYTTLAPGAATAPVAEQPLFPTLDSWNVMYGKNEVA